MPPEYVQSEPPQPRRLSSLRARGHALWGALPAGLRGKWVWIPALLLLGTALVLGTVGMRARNASQELRTRRGPIVEAVYGIGTVTAYKTYQIRFATAQTVRGIYVREGDLVRAGQSLVATEGDLMRTSNAPFAGTVTAIPYKVGEVVPPQTPVLTLTDLGDRYVVVSLEQQGAIRVLRGQPAILSFESLRNQSFRGTVRTVFSNDNQFLVHVVVPDLPDQILPGMTADVAIEVARRTDAVLVPVAAISDGAITVVSGNATRRVPIKLGTVDGEWAEVLGSDLRGGESVVLNRGGQ
jgi:multidrug efflux pump subunit AcrA (membrane-fusion protein)